LGDKVNNPAVMKKHPREKRCKYVERRLTETDLIVTPDVAVLVPGLVPGVVEARPLLQDGVVERVRLAAAPLTSLQILANIQRKKKFT
jgi:hypothetical protein